MSTQPTPPADDGITLKMVMEHMQHQGQILMDEIKNVRQEMGEGFRRVYSDMQKMEHRLVIQIDAIDQRLDAIEIENIPKRMCKVEKHLGLVTA